MEDSMESSEYLDFLCERKGIEKVLQFVIDKYGFREVVIRLLFAHTNENWNNFNMWSFGSGFQDVECKYGMSKVLDTSIVGKAQFLIGHEDVYSLQESEKRINIVDDVYGKSDVKNFVFIVPIKNKTLPDINCCKNMKFYLWGMNEVLFLAEKYLSMFYDIVNEYTTLVYRWIFETSAGGN